MNGKYSLWIGLVCFNLAFGLFVWAIPSQSGSGIPPSSQDAHRRALSDYQTTRLSDYQTNPTPTPFYNPTATPPTQGGHGRNLFDLYCMPCHGDVGQGLTDEFRFREYPPEDTNCWKSGCHGDRPYDNGFKLPKTIPALIGAGALQRFHTARNMYDFIRTAMPFNKPGSLSQEQYLQLLAFMLEQNHVVADGARLEPDGLQNIVLGPEATPTPTVLPVEAASETSPSVLIGVIILLGVAVGLYLVARSRSSPSARKKP